MTKQQPPGWQDATDLLGGGVSKLSFALMALSLWLGSLGWLYNINTTCFNQTVFEPFLKILIATLSVVAALQTCRLSACFAVGMIMALHRMSISFRQGKLWDMETSEVSGVLGSFLLDYGLLAIFIVMLIKHLGVPIPVPSDIITITAGVQVATGDFSLAELALALGLAVTLGGTVQFFIVRSLGRRLLHRTGRFIGLTPRRLERARASLEGRGPLAVLIGVNVPGARAGVIPAAALAGLAYPPVATAMIAGNALFYGWHVALGFAVGPAAILLLERVNTPLWPMILLLILAGLAGWLLLRRRHVVEARVEESIAKRLHAWTEAACPGCVAATVVQSTIGEKRMEGIMRKTPDL
jgi:membrane protein DedA with SNARE-associated domain